MEILERPYGMRAGFAPLNNIGFCLLEVNLDGEVYEYSIPGISEHCEVERVEEGWSNTDISKETGINATTVSQIRRGTVPRYRTDKYTWSKHSGNRLDRDTIFSIYDEFTYTDKSDCELGRKYNVSRRHISNLRIGHRHSDLAREYVNSKGLDGYWQGYRHPK